ncbi:phospholipase A [Celerinatantimonas sp. MCCC 1A17872]|uniref:phospholipase A n=1 Tax=Celerinatantimonas sp. MCCC 1A17872 TaxID=3177514 RepID=UPI0038C7E837
MSKYLDYFVGGIWLISALNCAQAAEPAKKADTTDDASSSVEPQAPEAIETRAKKAGGLVQQRLDREKKTQHDPFVITPYRPNYVLPVKYTPHPDQANYVDSDDPNDRLDSTEVKFQVSFKIPVAYDVVGKNSSLWVAYTQQSFWQAYNSKISSPFRESNYEPEVFMQFNRPNRDEKGMKFSLWRLGLDHQSNGRSRPESRSWNRIYAEMVFESEHNVVSIKPWYRIPESASNDDNPNIEKYYGYGELNVVHVWHDLSFDMMLRNNLRQENKGAVQVGVSFPLWGRLRGYVQYFNGYGESLIDYNQNTESLGIGVMLTNWL